MTYTVVLCSNRVSGKQCKNVWIVEGGSGSSKCGRCGKTHQFKKLKKFFSGEDIDAARKVRAAVQADVTGQREGFETANESGVLQQTPDDVEVIDEDKYMEEMGIDVDEVSQVGSETKNSSRSQKEIISDGIREQDSPSEDDVIDYAIEYGVTEEKARSFIKKMKRSGDITQSGASLRLL